MPISTVGGAVGGANVNTPTIAASFVTHVKDDLLLVLAGLTLSAGNPGITAPGDWNVGVSKLDGSDRQLAVFWKFATAPGTAGPTITFVNDADSISLLLSYVLRGVLLSDPIDNTGTSSGGNAPDIGPITAVQPSSTARAVVVVGMQMNDFPSISSYPSGDGLTWTAMGAVETTAGTDASLMWSVGIWGEAGQPTITNKTFDIGFQTSTPWAGGMMHLNAAPENRPFPKAVMIA